MPQPKRIIAVGQRFGHWTVLDPDRRLGSDGWRAKERAAECRCDCGTRAVVRLSDLTGGLSQSCGRHQHERVYAERACITCEEMFTPAGSRQRFCDSCKPAKQMLAERTTPARDPWVRKQESIACRSCGAAPGRQCVTTSGTFAGAPHAARFEDAGGDAETETRQARQRRGHQKRAERNRNLVFAHYGTVCACCGTTEDLTIDHIHGGGKRHRQEIGSGSLRFYVWLIKNNFPAGYQTLCMSCNGSKWTGEQCRIHNVHQGRPVKQKTIRIPLDLLDWFTEYAAMTGRRLGDSLVAALVDFQDRTEAQGLGSSPSVPGPREPADDKNRRPAA